MAITRSFKVYGIYDGVITHRQKISFFPSFRDDFSTADDVRILECDCSDKTGTNDFVVLHITRNTAEDCIAELNGQITDGIFENCRVGKVEEI